MPSKSAKSKTSTKSALGDPSDIVGNPVKVTSKATGTTANRKTRKPMSREKAHMQTIYLRESDLRTAIDAEHELRKSRRVPGRVGISLLFRIGLEMLAEELKRKPKATIARAARIATPRIEREQKLAGRPQH